jgi:Glucodextranase, domain B
MRHQLWPACARPAYSFNGTLIPWVRALGTASGLAILLGLAAGGALTADTPPPAPSVLDFAIYATGTGCGAITISGSTYVDSFDSSQGSYSQTRQLSQGIVGTAGNINLSSSATINGPFFALNTAVGKCSNGVPGITLSGSAKVTGGYVQFSAAPQFPNPPPVTPGSQDYSFSTNGSLAPGSYGNITVSGGKTLTFSPGTYNINSITLSGGSILTMAPAGQVIINVAGNKTSKPVNLSGGSMVNPTAVPLNLQLVYGGNQPITLSGGSGAYGIVYAPNAPATLSGGADWYGAIAVATINISGGSPVHYDRSLAVPPAIAAGIAPAPNAAGWNMSSVTVSFACSDAILGISSCTPPVQVSAEGAHQTVTGTAVNQAGFSASTAASVSIDLTLPLISGVANPPPNAAGWNNGGVTVSFTCSDALSGVASCTSPVTLATEGARQIATGTATDTAGNTASAPASVSIDLTPPAVAITSPANGATVSTAAQTVSGTVSDALSGIASVSCNGAAASVSGTGFTCGVTLVPGANAITVQAQDLAGNTGTSSANVTFGSAVPTASITSPTNLSFLNTAPVTVNGTISDPTATISVNGIDTPQSNGQFSVPVPLIEGNNTITVVAQNPAGTTGTASIQVTLDTTPPHVMIDAPADGAITTESSITVNGLVNDIVVGTVNDQQAQVVVNGVPAQVANRTFLAPGIPLVMGSNTITATATDRSGNSATTSITVLRQPVTTPSLTIVSGNNQSGVIGTQLPAPLVAKLTDATGQGVANAMVVFRVTGADGLVSAGGPFMSSVTATTDANGQAQANYQLGTRAGAGNNMVEASATGIATTAVFTASANLGNAAQIIVDTGNDQSGAVGQALPLPFVVVVVDQGYNRMGGVPVTFTVTQGGGNINGQSSVTMNTDSDGRALAVLTLGPADGISNNQVTATFPGNSGLPATFTATGLTPGPAQNTAISGVVLDNSGVPIQGVTMRLYQLNQNGATSPQQVGTPVQTDAQGQFLMQPAPVGVFKLMADGTTAQRPASFPTLEYDIVTVPGQNNTVGLPIYLPQLSTAGQLCVSPTTGGTLTMPQAPGFALTIAAGSATFPGGSRSGCVSVSMVNVDKVPMSPGFGQQPRFIVTIQPVGTMFDPPAPITIPNIDGLAPRQVTELYSYDHDLAEFVSIGTGTVSDDGSVIVSDPGVGVLKAGWHCGGNPNSTGTAATCPACQMCNGTSCVPDPAQEGMACTQPNQMPGVCMNGSCVPVGTVEVYQPAANSSLYITADPQMPSVTAMARILGVTPDPTPTASFDWSLNISYTGPNGRQTSGQYQQSGVVGGSWMPYNPASATIRGGNAVFMASTVRAGQTLTGSSMGVQILGINPSHAQVNAALGGFPATSIACWESLQRLAQFNGQGLPLFGGPNGYGIMQVDNPPVSDDGIWNWRENVSEGLGILAQKQQDAIGYPGRVQAQYPHSNVPDFCALGWIDNQTGHSYCDLETIQRYNGGAYWHWNDSQMVWVRQPPNNYVQSVLSVTCN